MVIFHGKLLVYQRVTIQTGIHVRSVRSKYLGSTVIWWISAFVWFMWKECTFDFWISVIFMDVTRALTHLQQTTLAFESRVAKSFSKNIWNPFRGHNSASWHHMSLPFSSRTFWDHIPQKHRSPAADGRHPGHLPFPAISSSAFRLPQAAAAGCWAVSARTCHGLGWRQGKILWKLQDGLPNLMVDQVDHHFPYGNGNSGAHSIATSSQGPSRGQIAWRIVSCLQPVGKRRSWSLPICF